MNGSEVELEYGEILTHHRASCHQCIWYGANRSDKPDAREDLRVHLFERHGIELDGSFKSLERFDPADITNYLAELAKDSNAEFTAMTLNDDDDHVGGYIAVCNANQRQGEELEDIAAQHGAVFGTADNGFVYVAMCIKGGCDIPEVWPRAEAFADDVARWSEEEGHGQ